MCYINYKKKFEYRICKDGVHILSYKGGDTDIVIPKYINCKPVVCICKKAFVDCISLTSVKIPSKVTIIDTCAFAGCRNLTSVIFEKKSCLTNIGDGAFYECESLTGIEIPSNVELGVEALNFKGIETKTVDGKTVIPHFMFEWQYGEPNEI